MRVYIFLCLALILSMTSYGGEVRITNKEIREHAFLSDMYHDVYFPKDLVDKGKAILLRLCFEIETTKPGSAKEVYKLTHKATEEFNNLAGEFYSRGSEIETAARDNIGRDVEFILKTYGYKVDIEEALSPRDW